MRIPLSVVFIAFILAEIAAFILVGEAIGVLPTLGLVILGIALGSFLLRRHSMATLLKVRADMEQGRTPAKPLAEGAVLTLASLMIILPGFVTDAVGLLLFLPPVRRVLWRALRGRAAWRTAATGPGSRPATTVVDLDSSDYRRAPTADDRAESPWRLPQDPRT
jgi:UPF0716 protein FxsA